MKGIKLRGRPVYMDMQATTPMDPRVLDSMMPFLTEQVGAGSFRNAILPCASRALSICPAALHLGSCHLPNAFPLRSMATRTAAHTSMAGRARMQ